MHVKTVRVTNPNNVLVQIPGFVVANWQLQTGDNLEVTYVNDEIRLRKAVQGRGDTSKESQGVA